MIQKLSYQQTPSWEYCCKVSPKLEQLRNDIIRYRRVRPPSDDWFRTIAGTVSSLVGWHSARTDINTNAVYEAACSELYATLWGQTDEP